MGTLSTSAAPKYRLLLRPIGAYLDTLEARNLTLAESEQGFIWRCLAREDPAQLLCGVVGHDEIPQLTESVKAARLGRVPDLVIDEAQDAPGLQTKFSLPDGSRSIIQPERRIDAVCPFGYEELLRCLSYKLDRVAATSFMLQESDDSILVQYTLAVPLFVQMEPDRFISNNYFHEDVLYRDDAIALVRRVRGFRGTSFYH